MKTAMKAKDKETLEALRAVKSAILLAKSESGSGDSLSEQQENKLLQKLVKQRKDSATIYKEQGREDLAAPELTEAEVIQQFLPEPLSEEEILALIDKAVTASSAQSIKDMGKVMGMVNKQIAGRADGKTVAHLVKKALA